MFDQGRYWKTRGERYTQEFAKHTNELTALFKEQEAALLSATNAIWRNGGSILEIGVGFGRITKLMLENFGDTITEYTALDISDGQIRAAKEYLGPLAGRVDFLISDFRKDAPDRKWDIVLASEVFLHFPPSEVRPVVNKALKLARHYLIHIDPIRMPRLTMRGRLSNILLGRIRQTAWSHNFIDIYNPRIVRKVSFLPILGGLQGLFIVEVREQ